MKKGSNLLASSSIIALSFGFSQSSMSMESNNALDDSLKQEYSILGQHINKQKIEGASRKSNEVIGPGISCILIHLKFGNAIKQYKIKE
jgi:hypothetical protein